MDLFAPPVPGGKICQLYKPSWNPSHAAIDWCAPKGTPIVTVLSGTVVVVANTPHGGNNLIIRHDNGLHTYYAHMDRVYVRQGERVKALQQIGTVGATGSPNPGVTFIDPHLHMQVQAKQTFHSEHYNPLDFLAAQGIEERDRVMYWKEGFEPKAQTPLAKAGPGVTLLLLGLGIGYLFWSKVRTKM